MRSQHRRYAVIGMTNEFRSSQTCIFCFEQTRLAKGWRKGKDGTVKLSKLHGAIECFNPACPSFQVGYTIRPRDTHSAVAIMIAGASLLLSPDRRPIAPFDQYAKSSIITTNNTRLKLDLTTSLVPSKRTLDELPHGCL